MTETHLFAAQALLPEGWARDVLFEFAADGTISAVHRDATEPQAQAAPRAAGPVIPGMPNLHSHAFQRAMAGLSERASPADDDFWTWRALMYAFVARLNPAQVEAIATQLYIEMLKAGYTGVGEFHYLHHQPDGVPYADPAEMSQAIMAAADAAGIGLTHLPVFYEAGDFGGAPPTHEGQRRFLNDPDRFLRLIEAARAAAGGDPQVRIGIAPHSLRAVTQGGLTHVLTGLENLDPTAPVHIHIAEQAKEVRDCIAWCGARPVEWLLDNVALDRRWCLVHATHMSEEETRRVAASGVVAGLCPTTEANLGDGVFPAPGFLAAGGRIGIGSDSHVSVSPIEELRWLEYGQRLTLQRRNVLAGGRGGVSVGARLYMAAVAGGAQALGRPIGRLAAGGRADLVVLDDTLPTLVGRCEDVLLDAVVFAGNVNPVRDVMVGARWVVREGYHPREEAALAAYRSVVAELSG
ncbi:MAG: formimidoylglutamate deiminase [Alphaproteobacteria bacterium]|nr:MAG: formimidoylglutamate deiminase [Alphaproteobacteria bacterium]